MGIVQQSWNTCFYVLYAYYNITFNTINLVFRQKSNQWYDHNIFQIRKNKYSLMKLVILWGKLQRNYTKTSLEMLIH